MNKKLNNAYKTIGEVAELLNLKNEKNGKLNTYKRTLVLLGSVTLLIPPLEIIYGLSGFYYNLVGVLVLLIIYFLQDKLTFKSKVTT